MTMTIPKYLAGLAASLILFGMMAPAVAQMGQMPPAQIETTTAIKRLMAPKMDVTGTVISLNDSAISAEVEGVLTSLAHVGTAVKKGDVIARIDDRLLAINFRRAEAALRRLEADLPRREADVKRFEGLAKNDNASKARLEEVIAVRNMLLQDIADARAVYDRAEGDLARTRIRASFDGHVAERIAGVGEYMTVGDQVLRLVDSHNIEIAFPAPIALSSYLKVGQEVSVHLGSDVSALEVRTVVPVGDIVSRQVEVRLSADAGDWTIGSAVTVKLPTSVPTMHVAVHRDALVRKGARLFLFRVGKDNKAEQIPITIAAIDGMWIAVEDGLEDGDRIVIRGGERLQNGQAIAPR